MRNFAAAAGLTSFFAAYALNFLKDDLAYHRYQGDEYESVWCSEGGNGHYISGAHRHSGDTERE